MGIRVGPALAACATFSAGCAQLAPTRSGYLSDYADLRPTGAWVSRTAGAREVYARPAAAPDLAGIDSFYVEPVGWLVSPAGRAGRDPKARAALTAALECGLRDELAAVRPVVAGPGPRTARVRACVTDAALSRPWLNAVLTAALGPVSNGGGVAEAEVTAPGGGQVAAVVSVSAGGPLELFGFYLKTRHAENAMRRAARDLRDALSAAGGGADPLAPGAP